MIKEFDFDGLFVLDMANNHQGSLDHGKRIITELSRVINQFNVRGAIKFQFRNLETFIHPAYTSRNDVKHIPRFLSTRLSREDYAELTNEVREAGLIPMATPFDEESLDLIQELDLEIVKIASCSATDWPLIYEIAKLNKPVIVSTAGLSTSQIDNLVAFFHDSGLSFALMHCVALYPTPIEYLQLNQIANLCRRYPEVPIGYSTHELPDYYNGIRMAYCLGARLFERHVDVKEEGFSMNAYSSTPEQIEEWIKAYKEVVAACGPENRAPASEAELASLNSLKRGVYAKRTLEKGESLTREDVFFAMPLQEDQLESGDWMNGLVTDKLYKEGEALSAKIAKYNSTREQKIKQILLQVRGILNEARIAVGSDFSIELSHHYGLERFREFGAVIINCVNREYCKKLIIQLPRQKHPYHYHRKKEETFLVLHGDIDIEIDGNRRTYLPGDMVVIKPGQWHKFQTSHGVVVEEISTTHYDDDSIYQDKYLRNIDRKERKTFVPNWTKKLI